MSAGARHEVYGLVSKNDFGRWTLDIKLNRSRLLLGNAVNGSHAPDERFAINGNNAARWKHSLQRVQRALVICVAEDGSQYNIVRDVEVCVTRR